MENLTAFEAKKFLVEFIEKQKETKKNPEGCYLVNHRDGKIMEVLIADLDDETRVRDYSPDWFFDVTMDHSTKEYVISLNQ